MNGTPLVPGWYINFQAAVIKQLPRPDLIDQSVADKWEKNQERLSKVLTEALLPPKSQQVEVEVSKPQLPDLSKTGNTFADWLVAREQLHFFLTGEKVVLRDLFEISNETLVRTDIMPVFRPAGASNRDAMDWKVKLGMNPAYEETDVMRYKNSVGPKVPELYYINRSVKPDVTTLGKQADSPDQLLAVTKFWLGLYGWSDADNLLYMITGKHLDSDGVWSWFLDDQLPGYDKVAGGRWRVSDAQARFIWFYRVDSDLNIRARLATPFSLKKTS